MSSPALSRVRAADRNSSATAKPEPRPAAHPVAAHPPAAHARPHAPAPAPARAGGRYRMDRCTGAWWWSPEMFDLHGLPPGSPQPDTDTYLRLQHPDDRERVVAALASVFAAGRAFALETRIVRPDGSERAAVLMGEPQLDPAGSVAAVAGMCIDLTGCRPPGSDAERAAALEAEVSQLRAAMASRAQIEQAKGMLMLLTNCGDQIAFNLLAHISSHTHRKVRDVAHVITESAAGHGRLPDDVRAIIRDACPPAQPLR
jgi:PAS domain-containing protein